MIGNCPGGREGTERSIPGWRLRMCVGLENENMESLKNYTEITEGRGRVYRGGRAARGPRSFTE